MQQLSQWYCDKCEKHASECMCPDTEGSFVYLENGEGQEIDRARAFELRERGLAMFEKAFNDYGVTASPFRPFVMQAMQKAPLYFWVVPASSSGKYHTPETQGQFGLAKHTLMVMYYAHELSRTFGIADELLLSFSAYSKTELIVAAAIHDLCKYGQDYDPRYFGVHECLPAVYLGYKGHNIMKMLPPDSQQRIIQMIAHHNGSLVNGEWTTFRKPPETQMEKCLHIADYVASRKEIRHASFDGLTV